MKRKLQLESPISRAVAKAGRESREYLDNGVLDKTETLTWEQTGTD